MNLFEVGDVLVSHDDNETKFTVVEGETNSWGITKERMGHTHENPYILVNISNDVYKYWIPSKRLLLDKNYLFNKKMSKIIND